MCAYQRCLCAVMNIGAHTVPLPLCKVSGSEAERSLIFCSPYEPFHMPVLRNTGTRHMQDQWSRPLLMSARKPQPFCSQVPLSSCSHLVNAFAGRCQRAPYMYTSLHIPSRPTESRTDPSAGSLIHQSEGRCVPSNVAIEVWLSLQCLKKINFPPHR
jgi:hypothetical protein